METALHNFLIFLYDTFPALGYYARPADWVIVLAFVVLALCAIKLVVKLAPVLMVIGAVVLLLHHQQQWERIVTGWLQ